jgi:hypothetical protein
LMRMRTDVSVRSSSMILCTGSRWNTFFISVSPVRLMGDARNSPSRHSI